MQKNPGLAAVLSFFFQPVLLLKSKGVITWLLLEKLMRLLYQF